ncbi:MAG: peptidyl-prolyl cis-trans isomerase [Lachnospiraceae bacterium]
MKKQIKAIAVALSASLFLSGCSIAGKEIRLTTGLSKQQLFEINDTVCTMPEAKIYLMNYQNIYGTAYGVDLWKNEAYRKKMEQYIKDLTVSELSQVICMDFLAERKNVELSKEEEQKIEEAAKKYYDSLTKEEKAYTGASEKDVETLYRRYLLAQKTYQFLTDSVDSEVSDSEARVMRIQQIVVNDQAVADEVKKKLKAGNDFAGVASNYNLKKEIELTAARGELPEKVEKAAFELDDGEISKPIKTDGKIYFIKCVNKFEEELTDLNKKKILTNREQAALKEEYADLTKDLKSIFYDDIWEKTTFKVNDQIRSDSFFTVYDQTFQKKK